MSDADLYRQYAKEAMHVSSKVANENEKRTLVDVAYTWALAALMSDRVLGSSFVSSLGDVGEAASHAPSNRAASDSEFSVESGAGKRTVTSA
ncbi:MAG: hypothetical protein WCD69_09565 [Xanthobacteraceae bacterium]